MTRRRFIKLKKSFKSFRGGVPTAGAEVTGSSSTETQFITHINDFVNKMNNHEKIPNIIKAIATWRLSVNDISDASAKVGVPAPTLSLSSVPAPPPSLSSAPAPSTDTLAEVAVPTPPPSRSLRHNSEPTTLLLPSG